MAPIVDGLERQYHGQLAVKRINANTGDGPQIMRDYRLPGHPVLLLFDRQGRELHRLFGRQSAETVEALLPQILSE